MPLLPGNKFNTKKTPPRRSLSLNNLNKLESSIREEEYGIDYGQPAMRIAGQVIKFDTENGIWISEKSGSSGGVSQKEFIKLRKRNESLVEENNLLKLKIEILLDMLTETTSEKQELEQDLEHYGSGSKKSNRKR
ncbi:protein chibby homolog 1-like [Acanthaster planci]|uniref:Protein chibby homolog 1-like n=1 Tax=Acanthaster planci TaxID=133434 RepID=A0A8B7YQA8_ACAPL|nr:protein chibby homolog 1-like [Acanthaster planci]XP_022095459.1 protein chibby homolog 1-like [Acanthaster planci]